MPVNEKAKFLKKNQIVKEQGYYAVAPRKKAKESGENR